MAHAVQGWTLKWANSFTYTMHFMLGHSLAHDMQIKQCEARCYFWLAYPSKGAIEQGANKHLQLTNAC